METKTALKVFTLSSLALFWIGCEAGQPSERRAETTSNINGTRPLQKFAGTSLGTLKKAPAAAIPAAIDIEPANGALFDRQRTSGLAVHFSGFTIASGQTVEVQVLNSPGTALAEENWVTIATTTSVATATTYNDPAPIFRYDVDGVPSADDQRWPQGGILRFRAIVTDSAGVKTLLPFFDTTSGDCIAAAGTQSWRATITKCKSPFSPDFGAKLGSTAKAAALVSPTPEPGDGFRPNYLSRKGFIFDNQTDDYYDFVDAPRTLDDFRFRFGFDTKNEVSAVYYNLGDLGIGREMHCTTFQDRGGEVGTACYVRNYGDRGDGVGDFSGDADRAMSDAVRERGSFAAVCMVKFGSKYAAPNGNDVQFFVYNAQDQIANRAQLDSVDSNDAIPNNCINCHGGEYDARTGVLTNSAFLPFDPEGFLFAGERGFGYADQEEAFRKLNVMMRNAGAPPATFQFVNGIYGDKAEQEGTHANLDWIPPGWATSEEAKTVYREVYKPYCRTCHTSQVGDFAFMTYEDFKGEAAKTMNSACVISEMPVAEATMGLFWRGSARAYLVNALDQSSACTPGNGR